MKKLSHLIGRGVKYLTDEDYRFLVNSGKGLCDSMPDEEYLKRMFKAKMGRELDLENPQTFNEKLQWMKIQRPQVNLHNDGGQVCCKKICCGYNR